MSRSESSHDAPTLRITALTIYPVKGLAGVPVDRMRVEAAGPADDRRYMVVDAAGEMVTQRTVPALARLVATVGPDGLTLSAPDGAAVTVAPPQGDVRRAVRIWRSRLALPEVDGARGWLEAVLGPGHALVYLPDDVHRGLNPKYGAPHERVSLADGYPLLLTSAASLRALSVAIGGAVPLDMRRFRPNVVVDGGSLSPWAELTWRSVRLGAEVVARVTKPCVRCAVTTVDPDHGRVDGTEPLRTLARLPETMREVDGARGPVFGVNLVAEHVGLLRVGDPVVAH